MQLTGSSSTQRSESEQRGRLAQCWSQHTQAQRKWGFEAASGTAGRQTHLIVPVSLLHEEEQAFPGPAYAAAPSISPLCFKMLSICMSCTTHRQNSLHVLLWRVQDKASAELLQNLLRGSLAACHQQSLLQGSTWTLSSKFEKQKGLHTETSLA